MPQTDMNIANASGAAVRSDMNDHIAALVQLSSGNSAPGTTFAHMLWADTSPVGYTIVKIRDAADSGFSTLFDDEGRWKGADGTASEPSISFGADIDTGLYRIGANEMGLALGGVLNYRFDLATFSWTSLSATPGVLFSGAGDIVLTLEDSTAALNEKQWAFNSDAGELDLRAKTDIGGSGNLAMRFTRTGTVVDKLQIAAIEFATSGSVTRTIQNKGTDTTPSVLGIHTMNITGWAVGNDITDFDDAVAGQDLLVVGNDADANVLDGAPIQLVGGTTWNAAPGAFLMLWSDGTTWFELWRSDAS